MTSSFIIGKDKFTNMGCFMKLNSTDSVYKAIVIEKDKQFYHNNTIRAYLNDLKEMGFHFIDITRDNEGSLIINVSRDRTSRTVRVAFTMLVRYLWEGKHSRSSREDKFTKFFDKYWELRNVIKGYDKLYLMCLAHNLVNFRDFGKESIGFPYNANHALCYDKDGCKFLKNVLHITGHSVNENFTKRNFSVNQKEAFRDARTKEDYIKLLEEHAK